MTKPPEGANAPIVAALRGEVGPQVRKLKKRFSRAKKGEPEGVHDARTTLRRLRVQLEIMGRTAFDPERAARLERKLRGLEKSLSAERDAEVMLAHFQDHVKRSRSDRKELAELGAVLDRERRRGASEVQQSLAKRPRRKAVRALSRYIGKDRYVVLQPPKDATKASPSRVRDFTDGELWHLYDLARAYEALLRKDPHCTDVAVLHHFRSACRQLRFALELFEGALPRASRIAKDLHEVQDQIGEMHDHHVAVMSIEDWIAHGALRPTRALRRYVDQRVRERDALRRRYEARWLEILSPDFRQRLELALEPDARVARAA
jgi:CHAD domain-containing protein